MLSSLNNIIVNPNSVTNFSALFFEIYWELICTTHRCIIIREGEKKKKEANSVCFVVRTCMHKFIKRIKSFMKRAFCKKAEYFKILNMCMQQSKKIRD